MKNLRILKETTIGETKHAAGALVANVDNGIAARLVVDGIAKEEPAAYRKIVVPDLTAAAKKAQKARKASEPSPAPAPVAPVSE